MVELKRAPPVLVREQAPPAPPASMDCDTVTRVPKSKPRGKWDGFTDAERDAVEVALRLYIQARNPEKRQRYNKGNPVGPGSEAITWGHAVDVLATMKK